MMAEIGEGLNALNRLRDVKIEDCEGLNLIE